MKKPTFLCLLGLHSRSSLQHGCVTNHVCSHCERSLDKPDFHDLPVKIYRMITSLAALWMILFFALQSLSANAKSNGWLSVAGMASMVVIMGIFIWSISFFDQVSAQWPILDHHLSDFKYVKDGDCTRVSTCSKCPHEVRSIVHEFAAPVYETGGLCHRIQICRRDGEIHRIINSDRTPYLEHDYNEGHFLDPQKCEYVRTCRRCNAPPERSFRHDLQPSKRNPQLLICQRPGCRHQESVEDYDDYRGTPMRIGDRILG